MSSHNLRRLASAVLVLPIQKVILPFVRQSECMYLPRKTNVRAGKAGQLCLTLFAFLFSNTFLWPIVYHEAPMEYKVLISIANLTLIVLINFIGPWVLVRMQRIKRNIHGPWDEAVVQQS
ncbi:hypothetical protein CSKR_102189 [Clonorchis sinensis]|uniref:Uncharacterized protein n=1 Tax=Clonorchis sinensis TaxID=79923 RepID=A0A3R7G244_CLOSI|nr:hypothetical protein CSKR_102189 [Clonorchis sinensis]